MAKGIVSGYTGSCLLGDSIQCYGFGGVLLTRIAASEWISAIETCGCSNPCIGWSIAHWSGIARHADDPKVPVGFVRVVSQKGKLLAWEIESIYTTGRNGGVM